MYIPRTRIFVLIASCILISTFVSNDASAQRQTLLIDGHKYEGQTFGGDFHGRGLATLRDGTELKGKWENNDFLRGIVRRKDGISYHFEGRLKYLFRSLDLVEVVGAGTALFEDGRAYTGAIGKYGRFHGEGSLTLPDGRRTKGLWREGKLVKVKSEAWQETSFEAEGLDRDRFDRLTKKISDGGVGELSSLLVVKNGKILIEEYFNGTNRYSPHDVQSVGKSFTSTLVGIAVDQGLIPSLDEKLTSFLPDLDKGPRWNKQKDEITLKDLLTMSYGLSNDRSARFYSRFYNYDKDWIAGVMDMRLISRPGVVFAYSSAASRLFAPVIAEASGMPVEDFAQKYLFDPLEMDMYRFLFLPDGQPSLAGLEGVLTRDLAKFGQLYLNKGTWKGRRILSERWVEDATSSHLKVTRRDIQLTYGYYFWIREAWPISDRKLHTIAASGYGGNKIYIFPEEDLVVVITSTAFEDEDKIHGRIRRMMEEDLMPILLASDLQ